MTEFNRAVTPRKCGTCTLCCKVLGIEELAKPENAWCPHCAPGQGCEIYPDRPSECGRFSCRWLLDASLSEEWRPDRAKFVIFPDDAQQRILVHLDAGAPDAWRKEPYNTQFRRLAAHRLRSGGYVIMVSKRKCTIVFPAGEAYLGEVRDGDKIIVSEIAGPGGTRWEAKVIGKSNAQ